MIASRQGFVWVPWLIGVAAVALGLWVAKPKALDGDSKRAATSTVTTTALVAAQDKRGAVAAASVVKIGEANAVAPASPQRDFIAAEVPVALANLPAPDQTALIEAERRKVAVLSGKLELITPLYEQALHRADADALALARALAAKRGSDLALEQEAAERLGASRQARIAALVALVAIVLWLYVKITHLSPGAIAQYVTDVKAQAAGTAPAANPAIVALDGVTTRLQQRMVSWIAHFKARPPA